MEYTTDIVVWTNTGDDKSTHNFYGENLEIGKTQFIWAKNVGPNESEFIEFIILTNTLDLEANLSTTYQIHTKEATPFGRGTKFRVKSINKELRAVTFQAIN